LERKKGWGGTGVGGGKKNNFISRRQKTSLSGVGVRKRSKRKNYQGQKEIQPGQGSAIGWGLVLRSSIKSKEQKRKPWNLRRRLDRAS